LFPTGHLKQLTICPSHIIFLLPNSEYPFIIGVLLMPLIQNVFSSSLSVHGIIQIMLQVQILYPHLDIIFLVHKLITHFSPVTSIIFQNFSYFRIFQNSDSLNFCVFSSHVVLLIFCS
jgi:hypothetical protein